MISREIRNRQGKAVGESLPSTPHSRGTAGASGIPYGSFFSRMPHAVSQPPAHPRTEACLSVCCVFPAGACQAIFQSLAFQHQANSTVLAFPQHGIPHPAPSRMEHSLRPCSRGNHMQSNGCRALFQVSVFSWGRRTFIIQQNTPRCHAPLTCKCCYTV